MKLKLSPTSLVAFLAVAVFVVFGFSTNIYTFVYAKSHFECSNIPVPSHLVLSYSKQLPTLHCNFSISRQPDSSRAEQSGIFATVDDVDLTIAHIEVAESGSPNPKVIRSYRDGKQLDEDAPIGNDGIFTYQSRGRTLEFVTDHYIIEITGVVEDNAAREKYHPRRGGNYGDDHPGFDHTQSVRMKEELLKVGRAIVAALPDAREQKTKVEAEIPTQPAEEPREGTESPQDVDLYEDCKSQCATFQEAASKAYCDQRPDQESKNQCYQDLKYATEQCLHRCYINWSPEQMQRRARDGVRLSGTDSGGSLSLNLPSAYEWAVARVKEQTIEELRKGDFLGIDLPNGRRIEIDVADIPTEPPPTPEESFGGLAITQEAQELINRWRNPEGTLIYHQESKRYRSLKDILRESRNAGSAPWVSELPLYREPPQTIVFSSDGEGGCCPQIIFGTDSQGKSITDPGLIVTVPEARQMIKIQDTSMAILPNSRVALTGPNSVELSQGVIEIQRPDEIDGVFTVTTSFGSVTSEKTRFWVAHNPLSGYTLVGVREGKVSMTHGFTGEIMTLEPQENGDPNIAILLQPDFDEAKRGGGAFLWILIVAALGGVVYFVYRDKDKIVSAFKK